MKKLNEDTLTEQPVIEWLKEMSRVYKFYSTNSSSRKYGVHCLDSTVKLTTGHIGQGASRFSFIKIIFTLLRM